MSLHMPRFETKGSYITPACSCGWRGKRGSYGNSAGWGYLRAALAAQWVEHAKKHGMTDDGVQIKVDSQFVGEVRGTLEFRRRYGRRWQPGTLASREHTICELMAGVGPITNN